MSKLKMISSFFMIVSLSIFFHLNIFADEFMSEFITEKEGECNKSSDIEKRFKNYYEKAADNGEANAQYYIGKLYYKGKGIEKDYKKAFEYLKKAAEQGHTMAQNALGKCFLKGDVEADFGKAFEYFKRAADQGYAYAQYNLGVCYIEGFGVEKADQRKAVEYWEKAANQGLDAAKEALKNQGIR